MKRRQFIAAATAVTAAPALAFEPPITDTPDVDPIRGWLDQWRRVKGEWGGLPDESREAQRLFAEANDLEERIYGAQASTRDGAVAQLDLVLDDRSFIGCSLEDPADRIVFENLRAALVSFSS